MRNQTLALAAISALALSVHAQTYNWTLSTLHAEAGPLPPPFTGEQDAGHGSGSGTITFASVPYGPGTIVTGFTGFLNSTGIDTGSPADQISLNLSVSAPVSTYATDLDAGLGIYLLHENGSVSLNLHRDPSSGEWQLFQFSASPHALNFFEWHVNFTVVPEPHEYAAVACAGLVGFGLWRRRAQRAVQA